MKRAFLCALVCAALPVTALAHCDTMDGPVVLTAKAALEKGDVTPVLKWVRAEDEAEIRAAFQQTLAVRAKGAEAKELADRYFFETLIRVHRAGEGAPYDGLKPSGAQEPVVVAADRALDSGSAEALHEMLNGAVASGLHERFARVVEAKQHADESVAAGREFVEAYVGYVHYVERLFQDAAGGGEHHAEPTEPAPHHSH